MTTPASPNAISLNDVNTELGLAQTNQISLNDTLVRKLAGLPTNASQISMNDLRNKSGRVNYTASLVSHVVNYEFTPASVPGYVAGNTNATFVINPGIHVYSDNVIIPAFKISGFVAGDIVTIVNKGYIMGKGGDGGCGGNGGNGGPAILINCPISSLVIDNTQSVSSYIGGGGGGGGGAYAYKAKAGFGSTSYYYKAGGGGGAGGGAGGYSYYGDKTTGDALGATGGGGAGGDGPPVNTSQTSTTSLGRDGGTGYGSTRTSTRVATGGGAGGGGGLIYQSLFSGYDVTTGAGGGRLFPGIGGICAAALSGDGTVWYPGDGNGGAGGNQGGTSNGTNTTAGGGSVGPYPAGGGGGGWGASGGGGGGSLTGAVNGSGGIAGKAVVNGYVSSSVSFVNNDRSRIYGLVG